MLIFERQLNNINPEKLINTLLCFTSRINKCYICDLLSDIHNNIMLYSFDNNKINIDIDNCPCVLIYNVQKCHTNKLNIFIMFIATKYKFRGFNYATLFLREFIEFIINKFYNKYDNINIILDSVEESVLFYENIGFKWITTDQFNSDLQIDKEDNYEHFIMIYKIKGN